MNVLDLDQLRTFVAIAEVGSFTAAADVVHKTQSAVSMHRRSRNKPSLHDKPVW